MEPSARRAWQPMELREVGSVPDLVQQGGGKLSITGGDPGEPRKPAGQEPV